MRRREFIAGGGFGGHVCYTGLLVRLQTWLGYVAPFALLEVELNIGANPILRWNMLDAGFSGSETMALKMWVHRASATKRSTRARPTPLWCSFKSRAICLRT